jgi:hypothetical protein
MNTKMLLDNCLKKEKKQEEETLIPKAENKDDR